MTPKQIAENYRLAAKAITEGIYLVCIDIKPVPIYFKANRFRYTDTDSFANEDFQKYVYKEYKKPAKLITWYRPRVVWRKGGQFPESTNLRWGKFKRWENWMAYIKSDFKVLEWESIQAPETYEQVGDE